MKNVLFDSLNEINEKAHKYELNTLSAKISELESDINDYRLKVLFVG